MAVGYTWMLVLPFPGLGRSTYMDENALQPAQVRSIVASIGIGKTHEYRSIQTGIGDTSIKLTPTWESLSTYVTVILLAGSEFLSLCFA
jgi:hypothetical protein